MDAWKPKNISELEKFYMIEGGNSKSRKKSLNWLQEMQDVISAKGMSESADWKVSRHLYISYSLFSYFEFLDNVTNIISIHSYGQKGAVFNFL